MGIVVQLDSSVLRGWHVSLVERLAAATGDSVKVRYFPATHIRKEREFDRLLAIEHRLTRTNREAWTPVDRGALREDIGPTADQSERLINLSGAPIVDRPVAWTVTFDGVSGEAALLAAIRMNRLPLIQVIDVDGSVVAAGRPGSDTPGVMSAVFNDVTEGAITLISGALAGKEFAAPYIDSCEVVGRTESLPVAATRQMVNACKYMIYKKLYRAPHWRVGWRAANGTDMYDNLEWSGPAWTDLPDDGWHFYADPFLFDREGRKYLFVEDFDHRVGKGVISVVEFGSSGPVGTPRVVLNHDVHLSYPFVLEHGGNVWMIPETSQAGTVELYRAIDFPDRWEREAVLIDGMAVSDATPFEHDGRWWLTGTVRTGRSTCHSDSMHLWSAPSLSGPWTPHAKNPVLLDIASARPAGRVVNREGKLLRPVQDGRHGYGAALSVAEITRLDDEGFDQVVVKCLKPSEQWPGRRLHTLNQAGGLEVIDGSRMSPRLRWTRGSTKVSRRARMQGS